MVCGDGGKQWPSDFQRASKEHLLCAEVCSAVGVCALDQRKEKSAAGQTLGSQSCLFPGTRSCLTCNMGLQIPFMEGYRERSLAQCHQRSEQTRTESDSADP